jgi:hypothetical protein
VERETGIEPASLAWKARVLPLNYSRKRGRFFNPRRLSTALHKSLLSIANPQKRLGGGGWIRTSVGVSQQIYSLPPLATRAPLRRTSKYTTVSKARPVLATSLAVTPPAVTPACCRSGASAQMSSGAHDCCVRWAHANTQPCASRRRLPRRLHVGRPRRPAGR